MGTMGGGVAIPDGSMAMAIPAEGMGDGMAMMSMAGMVAMPGSNSFVLDLSAWWPGQHTIWIEPLQNDHTMFAVFGQIEVTVVVEGKTAAHRGSSLGDESPSQFGRCEGRRDD